MATVEEILDTVLKHEGGFQNDKEDRGNYYKGKLLGTNYGITPNVLANHLGRDVTTKDMRNMSKSTARDIYRAEYVDPIVRNLNPPAEVLPQLVDMAINHGYGNTVVMAQRAAGTKVDGKAGPNTVKAIQSLDPLQFNNSLVDTRKQFYKDIVKNRPDNSKYINGWINRAESFRQVP